MDTFNMDDIYINMFLEETKEQIEKMEVDFLLLEDNVEDADVINRIFRMAHSIKGAAATMGYEDMSSLAHNVESLLDKIRANEVNVTDEVMDKLFKSIDIFKSMHLSISKGEKAEVDIQWLVQEIKEIIGSKKNNNDVVVKANEEKTPIESKPVEAFDEASLTLDDSEKILCSEANPTLDIFKIKIIMNSNAMMKSVKGFLIVNNLQGVGEILKTNPSDFETVCDESYDGVLYILIATTKDYDAIYQNINAISEIKNIYLKKVKNKQEEKVSTNLPNMKIISQEKEKPREENVTIRVDVDKIDKLINLTGEFIIDKESLTEISKQLKNTYKNDPIVNRLLNIVSHISYISNELQETSMSTRMLPLENIFNRFPRMVRDLSKKCNKKIDFVVEGKETEVDRGIIEELIDPLTHIIRNAIDHGLEDEEERIQKNKSIMGTLKLSAKHIENNVVIEIEEDGRGLDVEKIKQKVISKQLATTEELKNMKDKDIINFIFQPGFSTAEKVSDISGRGVGLDVVKSNIGKLNGIIDIVTEVNKGTKFIIKLPLTLAIVKALIIKEAEYNFAIPVCSIIEVIRLKNNELEEHMHIVNNVRLYKWREQTIPVINIKDFFDIKATVNQNKFFLVIVGYAEKKAAFMIEKLIGEREIVVKPMDCFIGKNKIMGQIKGISGVSILRDGSFAQIIDVASIIKR